MYNISLDEENYKNINYGTERVSLMSLCINKISNLQPAGCYLFIWFSLKDRIWIWVLRCMHVLTPSSSLLDNCDEAGSSSKICIGHSDSDLLNSPLAEVLRNFARGDDCSADNPANPDDLCYAGGHIHHAVAADPGGHSAGPSQHWGINQLHMDCSGDLQLPGVLPQTQDLGAIVPTPRTAAPAPAGTQMDFTQATAPGS